MARVRRIDLDGDGKVLREEVGDLIDGLKDTVEGRYDSVEQAVLRKEGLDVIKATVLALLDDGEFDAAELAKIRAESIEFWTKVAEFADLD